MQQPDLFGPTWEATVGGTYRIYADVPRSRRTDPETSHEAAGAIKANGRLASHQGIVLAAVRAFPGLTSAELAMHCES
jgi:hypothetical protein